MFVDHHFEFEMNRNPAIDRNVILNLPKRKIGVHRKQGPMPVM